MTYHLKANRKRRIEVQSFMGRYIVRAVDELYTDSAKEAFEFMQKLESNGYEGSSAARDLGAAAQREREKYGGRGKPQQQTLNGPGGRVTVKPRRKSAKSGRVAINQRGNTYQIMVNGAPRGDFVNANDAYRNLVALARQGYRVSASDLEQLRIRAMLPSREGGGIRRSRKLKSK